MGFLPFRWSRTNSPDRVSPCPLGTGVGAASIAFASGRRDAISTRRTLLLMIEGREEIGPSDVRQCVPRGGRHLWRDVARLAAISVTENIRSRVVKNGRFL